MKKNYYKVFLKKIIYTLIYINIITNITYSTNMNDNLVAYFPLNNDTKLNSTINNHILTAGSYGVEQRNDHVYLTRGEASYLQTDINLTPYTGLAHSKNWTISMWFYSEDLVNNGFQCLWSQRNGDTGNQHSPLTSSDRIYLYDVTGTSLSTSYVYNNNWHNYIIMHQYINSTHSNWSIFLNGAGTHATSIEQSATTGNTLFGDYSGSGGNNLEGGIRDIAIYNKTLTQYEINEVFESAGEAFPGNTYLYPTPEDKSTLLETQTFTIKAREANNSPTNCNVIINDITYNMNIIDSKCVYTHDIQNSSSQKYTFQVIINSTNLTNYALETREIVIYKFENTSLAGLVAHFPLDNTSKLNSTISSDKLIPCDYGIEQRNDHVYLTQGEASCLKTNYSGEKYLGLGHTYNWSISMWFYSEDLINNPFQCLWSQIEGDTGYQHSPITNGASRIYLYGVSGVSFSTPSIPDTNWHNYIIMHQYLNSTHSNWTMVLDGVKSYQIGTEHSSTIGRILLGDYSGNGGNNLEGGLRDISFYNTILTDSKISNIILENGTTNASINQETINNLWNPPTINSNTNSNSFDLNLNSPINIISSIITITIFLLI